MGERPPIYGLVAEFASPERLIEAAGRARQAGFTRLDTFTPFPIDELNDALELGRSKVPLWALIGAIIGAGGAYFMLWYSAVHAYPWNIGGRPLNSWPSFVPITFELGVLGSALFIFTSIFVLNHLPQPYHPVFNVREMRRASIDRFFLCVQADDPEFDRERTRAFLESLGPMRVREAAW